MLMHRWCLLICEEHDIANYHGEPKNFAWKYFTFEFYKTHENINLYWYYFKYFKGILAKKIKKKVILRIIFHEYSEGDNFTSHIVLYYGSHWVNIMNCLLEKHEALLTCEYGQCRLAEPIKVNPRIWHFKVAIQSSNLERNIWTVHVYDSRWDSIGRPNPDLSAPEKVFGVCNWYQMLRFLAHAL